MKYLMHNKRYQEYLQAQDDLNKVLDEWILAFQKTQPKATTYGDKVQSSITTNNIEEYVIEVEEKHLYQRIRDAGVIIGGKKELADLAEIELRQSTDISDLVYTAKFVDGKRTKDIYRELDLMGISYSERQLYDIIRRIKAQIRFSE